MHNNRYVLEKENIYGLRGRDPGVEEGDGSAK